MPVRRPPASRPWGAGAAWLRSAMQPPCAGVDLRYSTGGMAGKADVAPRRAVGAVRRRKGRGGAASAGAPGEAPGVDGWRAAVVVFSPRGPPPLPLPREGEGTGGEREIPPPGDRGEE